MAKRNIGKEILDSVREIKDGGGRRYRFTAPEEIKQIREGVGVSQANFARMLGISLRSSPASLGRRNAASIRASSSAVSSAVGVGPVTSASCSILNPKVS